MLDEKKITFITCVNDEEEYAECRYYLNRLSVPEGYMMDLISIREAPSMAAGYNAGMKSSDARYKIYLHQDVFIRNPAFITDLLAVFACDEQIGIIGVIGKRNQGFYPIEKVMMWDTGKVVDNERIWHFDYPWKKMTFAEALAADGLMLATRYDIPWREDLFTGWDFYDISQCMEFRKAGFKVAIPWQETEWCYHNTSYVKLTQYYAYYKRFLQEYAGILGDDIPAKTDRYTYEKEENYAQAIEELRQGVAGLFGMGDRKNLRSLLLDSDLKKSIYLREYASIVQIDWQEEQTHSKKCFWEQGMSADQLVEKLRKLKYMLKRIEYTDDHSQKEQLKQEYSRYAVADVCSRYVLDKDRVLREITDIL